MRLVTFVLDGPRHLDVLREEGIADLTAADPHLGDDLVTLIADWDSGRVKEFVAVAPVRAVDEVRLLAPLTPVAT